MGTIKIGLTEFRQRWYELVSGVLQGHIYIVLREGRPIAQLGPVDVPPTPALPTVALSPPFVMLDPELSATVTALIRALGESTLALTLCTSPLELHEAKHTGYLSPSLHPQLDFLNGLRLLFLDAGRKGAFDRWFGRAHRRLGGRTPQMVLRGAWQPEDPAARLVRALAEASCAE